MASAARRGRARGAQHRGGPGSASRSSRPASARRSGGARSPLRFLAWSSSHTRQIELLRVDERTETANALAALTDRRAHLDGVVGGRDAAVEILGEAKC